MLKLTGHEARTQYPGLVVAALQTEKTSPAGSYQHAYSSTGPTALPSTAETRSRYQERAPLAADLKRVMWETARLGEKTFALTADVTEAHGQIPIHPRDWHLLGCQIEVGGDVYINTVGTFAVASASYCGSRAASAIGRLTQFLTGRSANTWRDFHLGDSGTEYGAALISFLVFCSTAGVSLSCGKTAGGDKVTWVKFELFHSTYHLGISERRAAWFIKWTEEVARSHTVKKKKKVNATTGSLDARHVAGALEHKRPFGLREVLPAVPLAASLTVEALRLCDGVASLGKQHLGWTHRPAKTEQR